MARGQEFGNYWLFTLSELQHFFKLPYLKLPKNIFRTSPTSIAVSHLKYKEPGKEIVEEVRNLVHLYNESTQPAFIKAVFFYKDLITLHPLTDGNGRGARAILSFLLLKEGILPPSLGLEISGDLYLNGQDFIDLMKTGISYSWDML